MAQLVERLSHDPKVVGLNPLLGSVLSTWSLLKIVSLPPSLPLSLSPSLCLSPQLTRALSLSLSNNEKQTTTTKTPQQQQQTTA